MFNLHQLGPITDLRNNLTWTREQFRSHISRSRASLEQLGILRHDKVVIAHGGTPCFFADLFALWSLGACAVCVNPALTKGELKTVVDFVDAKAVLMLQKTPIPHEGLKIPVIDTGEGATASAVLPEEMLLLEDDHALILFTSGTTGNPKGVVHTGRTLAARIADNRQYIGDSVMERTLCVLPTHFGHGLIGNCLTPLLASAHLFLFPTPGIQGIARIGEILSENKITFMSSVPAFWKMAKKAARPPKGSVLQRINVGSAPLSADLWKFIMSWAGIDNVNNMYGITETANWAAGASAAHSEPEDGLVGGMLGDEPPYWEKTVNYTNRVMER